MIMAKNITVETIENAIVSLHNNSVCYEFLKSKKYHSCWLRWIPCSQQVRTYIKMRIFNKMLDQQLVREYLREETDCYIRRYYVLSSE